MLIPVSKSEAYFPNVVKRVEIIAEAWPTLIDDVLFEWKGSLSEARRSLLARAKAPFVFNLDADSLVPIDYVRQALDVFKLSSRVGAVALDYFPESQGHLAFGTSIMRKDVMKKVYSWENMHDSEMCECMHVWRSIYAHNLLVATLPLWAEHKKDISRK